MVAAASEKGALVVNGMSYRARDLENANSAVLVGLEPKDFGSSHPLAGVELQREIERAASVSYTHLTMMIAKHSQRHFSKQWSSTGRLNGHIEEMYTGHNVVKLFNKQQEEIDKFNSENEILQGASFKAQFVSGLVMPIMRLVSNLNYVVVCIVGAFKIIGGGRCV